MTHETLSAIERALDNERCKLGSFEDLLSCLIDRQDRKDGPNPFYALLGYIEPITRQLAEIGEQLSTVRYAVQYPRPTVTPANDGADFSARLREFLDANTAYALASEEAKDDDAPRSVWRQLTQSRDALLATQPQTAEHARQLLAVCLAELRQDMVVGGPLPEAILAAMGASIQALEQP